MLVIRPLTENDRPAINRLIELCDQDENLELPIDPEGPGLVYQEGDRIVGFVSLESGDVIETTGMVHPDFRRRGIGRALLAALQEQCRQSKPDRCYVVLDDASPSGRAFIVSAGGRYHISEYRMVLDRQAFQGSGEWTDLLDLEPVDHSAIDLFSSLVAQAFGDPPATTRGWLEGDMQRPHRRFWVAYFHGEPIGTVRVIGVEHGAYVTSLGVLLEYRGRGFGRQILARTGAMLIAEGWDQVLIEVETDNQNALGLYRAVGFRETRTYGFYEIQF